MQRCKGLTGMLEMLSKNQSFDSKEYERTRIEAIEMQACYVDEFKILELMRMPFPLKDTQSGGRSEKTLRWLRYLKYWFLSPISALWAWHFGR